MRFGSGEANPRRSGGRSAQVQLREAASTRDALLRLVGRTGLDPGGGVGVPAEAAADGREGERLGQNVREATGHYADLLIVAALRKLERLLVGKKLEARDAVMILGELRRHREWAKGYRRKGAYLTRGRKCGGAAGEARLGEFDRMAGLEAEGDGREDAAGEAPVGEGVENGD